MERTDNRGLMTESLIPPVGVIPPAERLFRVNWVAALERSPSGVPQLAPEVVARQGRIVRLVDVRDASELVGPLGYVPGSDWIPRADALGTLSKLPRDTPIVLISRGGERASGLAKSLEEGGLRFVAALRGGMVAWKGLGYGSSRDPSIIERRGRLREVEVEASTTEGPLSRDVIADHLGDPHDVRWIKLAAVLLHAQRSCVDGRDDTGVIGTPGGDAGELALGLAAVEQHLGHSLERAQVAALLGRAADAFGSMYMHSDIHAGNAFIASMRSDERLTDAIGSTYEALEWRKWMAEPPAHVRDIVLEHLLQPGMLGCGHLRLMMQHPDDYGVRSGLVNDLVSSYLHQRWADSPHLQFVVLAGGHREGAVVNIRVDEELHSYTPIPLISPACGSTQMFVNHPQVSEYMRIELASFLCAQRDLLGLDARDTEELGHRMCELAERQVGVTLGHLAKGLPVYDVLFRGDVVTSIEQVGQIAS